MFAKITGVKGNRITLQSYDELNIDKLKRYANGKQPTAELVIEDGRKITPDQRKKIFALIHDVSQFTGYDERDTEMELKYMYYAKTGAEAFSMANCSMSQANEFLTFILDFCFENNVPFRTKIWDSIPVDYHWATQCLRYRKCVICGKQGEIDHYTPVGRRSRKLVDHRKLYFECLCHEHHVERHSLGMKAFVQKYHIKPVRLSDDDLYRLHIMTKKQMDYWDDQYARKLL